MVKHDSSTDTGDDRVRPGIWIPRKLWGKVRMAAYNEGVRAQVVVERILTEGLKGLAE